MAPTYHYPELVDHLKSAEMSLWVNKWNEPFDFTPNKTRDDGTPNYELISSTKPEFVSSLSQVKSLIRRVSKVRGTEIKSINEIGADDLDQIELEFDI